MRCPNCSNDLSPWPWQDGGHKGVWCNICSQHWWSDEMASKFSDAERAAVAAVMEAEPFPADAKKETKRK